MDHAEKFSRGGHPRAAAEHAPTRSLTKAFTDNRPGAIAQRELFDAIQQSPRVAAQRKLVDSINHSSRMTAQRSLAAVIDSSPHQVAQRQKYALDNTGQHGIAPAGKSRPDGLPAKLKSGIESLSGLSLDSVTVHRNSSRPAQLHALAYTQGTDIHIAPSQEAHLPHEAWHVVQQAEGRVQPTMQMKDGLAVNNDAMLEHEADVMGAKALTAAGEIKGGPEQKTFQGRHLSVIQRAIAPNTAAFVGRRVFHSVHGVGTIGLIVPEGYLVAFDNAGPARVPATELRFADAEQEANDLVNFSDEVEDEVEVDAAAEILRGTLRHVL